MIHLAAVLFDTPHEVVVPFLDRGLDVALIPVDVAQRSSACWPRARYQMRGKPAFARPCFRRSGKAVRDDSRDHARRRRPRNPPRADFSPRWLERYGCTLTPDEIQLVQARRGLPPAQQTHLNTYAAGLVVELASKGRVKAALQDRERLGLALRLVADREAITVRQRQLRHGGSTNSSLSG